MTESNKSQGDQVDTSGGSYVGKNVDTAGGDFIGRDKTVQGDEIRGDVTKLNHPTYNQGVVTITGKGHHILGDIVGGSKTEIVDSTLYLAGHNLFQNHVMGRQEFIAELQKLRQAITAASDDRLIEQEELILASAQVDAAISHVQRDNPDSTKLVQWLNDAKKIIGQTAAGAEVLAGLVTALNLAIKTVRSLF